MADSLEVVGPAASLESVAPAPPSVRQLLAELAGLEDIVRAGAVDAPEVLAALAREQEIVEELHRARPSTGQPA